MMFVDTIDNHFRQFSKLSYRQWGGYIQCTIYDILDRNWQ